MSATVPDRACFDNVVALYRHVARLRGVSQQETSRSLTDAVVEYIERHYAEAELSLQSVADAFHVSYYYLSRMFKSKTQQSFSELLNTCRVRKACEHLLSTDLQAQEIALRVGYTNTNTFYRAFRKLVGLTPQQYRAGGKGAQSS